MDVAKVKELVARIRGQTSNRVSLAGLTRPETSDFGDTNGHDFKSEGGATFLRERAAVRWLVEQATEKGRKGYLFVGTNQPDYEKAMKRILREYPTSGYSLNNNEGSISGNGIKAWIQGHHFKDVPTGIDANAPVALIRPTVKDVEKISKLVNEGNDVVLVAFLEKELHTVVQTMDMVEIRITQQDVEDAPVVS